MKKLILLLTLIFSFGAFANIVDVDESSLDQDLSYNLEDGDESQRDVASDEPNQDEEVNKDDEDSYNSLRYWKY